MFKFLSLIFLLGSALCGALSNQPTTQCREDDGQCLIRAGNRALQATISGVPSLSEPLNTIYGDLIYSNAIIPGARIVFKKPVLSGFNNCVATSVALSYEYRNASVLLTCPRLNLSSGYQVQGQEHGELEYTIEDLLIRVDDTFSIHQNGGIKTYQVYQYTIQVTPRGSIITAESDGRHFFNEHSKEIVLDFLMNYFMDIFMNRLNRHLSVTDMEKLLADRD